MSQRKDIAALLKKLEKKYGVSAGEFQSGRRRQAVVKAREVVFWIAVKGLGYSGTRQSRVCHFLHPFIADFFRP